MNKQHHAAKALLWIVLLSALALPAAAGNAGEEVAGAVFSWNNMGLMGPGDESAHSISLTRDSAVMQHNIEYHEGSILQKTVLYRTDDTARFRLLDALGKAAATWRSEYRMPVLDGSSWKVVVHYTDRADFMTFTGRGKTPPQAEELRKLILGLAVFETAPKTF